MAGLPFLDIKIDKGEIARRGLSLSDVQDVIGIAIGGRAAGLVFEGDRRFQIIVRLPDAVRNDVDALENLPVTLPQAAAGTGSLTIPLRQLATFNFSEGPNQISRENGKRRVVVTAEVRGRDIGSLVEEAQGEGRRAGFPAGGLLVGMGRAVRELRGGAAAPHDRRPGVLCIDLPAFAERPRLRARCAAGVQRRARSRSRAALPRLWLRDMPFSVSAAVGFIALSGVAVLNGLVMLSFIRQLIAAGLDKERCDPRGCAHAAAPGRHDRARRLARIRAHGARDRNRRGGAEAARNRGHRRADQRDPADAVRSAGSVRLLYGGSAP